MGSNDDLFGSDGKTVGPSRSGNERPLQAGFAAEPPSPRQAREQTVFEAAQPPPPGWSTGTIIEPSGVPAGAGEPRGDKSSETLFAAFVGLNYASPNPLLAAAAPLLMLLGDIQLIAAEREEAALATNVTRAIREFDRKTAEAGVPAGDVRIAKYALCETADDLIGNLPGIDRKAWLADGILARHFHASAAGAGFFDALNKALASPEAHYDLLELMHACLSLGFQGQYRNRNSGKDGLQRVRRDVYETLRFFRDRADDDISPSWEGLAATLPPKRRGVPLWAIAAIAPALLAAAFFALRGATTDRADGVVAELLALNPTDPATIRHAEFAPVVETPAAPPPVVEPPRPAQIERIRGGLAQDIANGGLEIVPQGDFIVVRVNNLVLFESGKAELKSGFEAMAERIAATLSPEPGQIRIVGHTDNVRPSRTSAFKSNYDLSVARAQAVESILKPRIGEPSRVAIDGKGEEEPIGDNATPEGRASNRRVEVMIQREETL